MNAAIAAIKSGRPFDVIDTYGWHMVLWNTGSGLVTIGMWKEGDKPVINDWRKEGGWLASCGIREHRTGIAAFVRDFAVSCQGWSIESWNVGGYGDWKVQPSPEA
jgi:hypothetical protein